MIFEDRVSAYPNRYTLTAADGSVSYVILERADEPVTVGTPLNAETFNALTGDVMACAASGSAYNLLDNSNFKNPVNQRNSTIYEYGTNQYTIDRWYTYCGVTVNDGYITVSNEGDTAVNFYQRFPVGTFTPLKTYTMAVMLTNGTLYVGSGVCPSSAMNKLYAGNGDDPHLEIRHNQNGCDSVNVTVKAGTSLNIRWIALYEGEYTAETLPQYRPKGYGVELTECMRYYQRITSATAGYNAMFNGMVTNGLQHLIVSVPLGVPMRIKPTVTYTSNGIAVRGSQGYVPEATYNTPYSDFGLSVYYMGNDTSLSLGLYKTDGSDWTNLITNSVVSVSFVGDVGHYIEVSADL